MAQKDLEEPPAGERSLRNPRRRNRPDSESIKTAPRRKRSKISANTFLARDTPEETENEEPMTNGHASRQVSCSHGRNTSVSIASGEVDMAMRGPRNGIKRTTRHEPSRVLTQNEHYSVKLLSSTPKELHDAHFRGSISASANLALALTQERAYIWDYNGHVGTVAAKSIELPFHVSQHETLPFGAFVVSSGSNDIGVLLVSATSGKMVYHESIHRVTSLGLFQERKLGVEGSISGLFAGEKVIQLADAGPAGFVALLKSGRAVHISLRDLQGKPHIQTRFLYTAEQASRGLFGSIKNIFGAGAWKQSVSAVRTRILERGQAQVLNLVERGELRMWDLDWSGHYNHRASVDFREQIQSELRQIHPVERQGDVDHLTLLDLAILEKNHAKRMEVATIGSGKPLDAILLARCGSAGMYYYSLIEFSLIEDEFSITRILDVHVESQTQSTHQERLLVPVPHTALIVLADTVAIVSLASAALDPEAQLHEASYIEPSPFQDAIYLKSGKNWCFTGGDIDTNRGTDGTGLLFVDNAGLVRITTSEAQPDSAEGEAAVQSRIEQAVFYGYQEGNILDLQRAGHVKQSEVDVENAISKISFDILHSSSQHFELPPVSVSANLNKRAAAAAHLAAYVQKLYPGISSQLKWQMLEHAENIAAGSKLWEDFEIRVNTSHKSKRKAVLLHEVCTSLQEKYHFDSLWPQCTPDDIVRTFFVTQLNHLDRLLAWTRSILNAIYKQDVESAEVLRLVSESDDIWLQCLNTALNFRKDAASQYGIHLSLIGGDIYADGALRGVPALWTSTGDMMTQLEKTTNTSREILKNVYEVEHAALPEGLVEKIASDNASLVDLMSQLFLERIAWCDGQDDHKLIKQGAMLKEKASNLRHKEIRQLAEIGQTPAGIALAEKYNDMDTLTLMLLAEAQFLTEGLETAAPIEAEGIQVHLDAINDKVVSCFEKFGDAFGEAFFSEGFYDGNAGRLLSEDTLWHGHMTSWLQKYPERAKVCWINDVLRVKDYQHASKSLYAVAMQQEHNTWSKKVELSLAKLTMYAASEETATVSEEQLQAVNSEIDAELSIADVQQRLYQHVLPEILQSLDETAAVEDAMNGLCCTILAFRTWHDLLSEHMAELLAHRTLGFEQLIDLITLADNSSTNIEDADAGRCETFEALAALAAAKTHRSSNQLSLMTKLTWKRGFLRENWEGINLSSSSETEQDMQAILQNTDVFKAVWFVLDAQAAQPDIPMALLEPSATLGAGCHEDELPAYIPDELREGVLEENMIMERQIEAMIREQRIEHWFERIVELAKEGLAVSASCIDGHVNGDTTIKTEEVEDQTSLADIGRSDIQML